MAFGKRSASDLPPARPSVELDGPSEDSLISAPGIGAVRTRVTNPGGIDLKFITLAAGVVVFAAGAAIALPSLGSVFSGGVRPIEEVIANLDRPAVRTALAAEAFPDGDGRAFMTSLATNFPREHGRLLDTLADTAMAGGDREDLSMALNGWQMNFVQSQAAVIGRTGAHGFNELVATLDETLQVIEAELGGCSAEKFRKVLSDPTFVERLSRYDGRGYHTGMRASHRLVELAASGAKSAPVVAALNANDNNILKAAFMSMLGDPQVAHLFTAISNAQGNHFNAQDELFYNVNFCKLGHTLLIKMQDLPDGTKSRLNALVMSKDFSTFANGNPFAGPGAFSGPNGGSPFSMLQGN